MKIKAFLIFHDSAECGDERVSAFLRLKKFDGLRLRHPDEKSQVQL
jgi:hypothetical protein